MTPHRLGIPEMAKRIGDRWESLGHSVEYILADGSAARAGPIKIGAPGIALWWYRRIKQIASDHEQYDLIWAHQPIMPQLPTTDETFLNKLIATIHTTLGREYELTREGIYPRTLLPYYWFVKTIESRSHQMITDLDCKGPHYTVVSPHLKDEIRGYGIESPVYIPNGVFMPQKSSFASIRDEYNIPTDATLVFNIGSLTSQKRAATFAQVMKKLTEKIDNTYVVMAGDGPLREEVGKYSSGNLQVLGYIEDTEKWRWFADADLFASLSAYEGMPVATAEALSFDLPVVLSDIASHRHIVETYSPAAELVRVDVKDCANAVVKLDGTKSDVDLPDWEEVANSYLSLLA